MPHPEPDAHPQRPHVGHHHTAIRCRGCGHDLTALSVGRCPECGREISEKQRLDIGLPAAPSSGERLRLLAERLSLVEFPFDPMDPRALSRVDDETAASILPAGRLPEAIYNAVRSARIAPPTALLLTLEAMVENGNAVALSDHTAIHLLPRSKTLHELYERLRQLGHSPIAAIERIMPHTPSYRRR